MRMGWLVTGFLGQALFTTRFAVQWIQSERLRRSVTPVAFWYFSLLGGITLLTYAVHQRDPVFIVGQAFGIVVYSRNLLLIARERRGDRVAPDARAGGDHTPESGGV
jgi:lipid-A-disaccharide synthase-like uncharacterized protein